MAERKTARPSFVLVLARTGRQGYGFAGITRPTACHTQVIRGAQTSSIHLRLAGYLPVAKP
jgi:hypothetical protein